MQPALKLCLLALAIASDKSSECPFVFFCERKKRKYFRCLSIIKIIVSVSLGEKLQLTRAIFVIQKHLLLWFTPLFKAISKCRQKKFSQPVIQNRHSRKVALKPVRQTLAWCGRRELFKRSYVLITKEEG